MTELSKESIVIQSIMTMLMSFKEDTDRALRLYPEFRPLILNIKELLDQEKEKEAIAFKDWYDKKGQYHSVKNNEQLYQLFKTKP